MLFLNWRHCEVVTLPCSKSQRPFYFGSYNGGAIDRVLDSTLVVVVCRFCAFCFHYSIIELQLHYRYVAKDFVYRINKLMKVQGIISSVLQHSVTFGFVVTVVPLHLAQ